MNHLLNINIPLKKFFNIILLEKLIKELIL